MLEATKIIFESGIPTLKNFFLIGLSNETNEDRTAIIELVKEQCQIAKSSGVNDPLIKVDIYPMVPKWQTPLKNWVYHFLPENRLRFQEILEGITIYKSFKIGWMVF